MKYRGFFITLGQIAVLVLSTGPVSYAASNSQTFTYQGRFLNKNGTAPLKDIVDITFSIYNPAGTCLLYQETQTNVDLTATSGMLSVQVGSGLSSSKRTALDPAIAMGQIFSNGGTIRGPGANCTSGYTSAAGEARILRVAVTGHSNNVTTTLSPDLTINSVPQAQTADSLQGLSPTDFLQTASSVAGQDNVSLSTLKSLTNGSDASSLHNHDGRYVRTGVGATYANLGSGAYTGGNFGIGTSSPTGNLGFGGSAGSQSIEVDRNTLSNSAGSSLSIQAGGATTGASNQSGGSLVLSSGVSTGSAGSAISFQTSNAGGAGTSDNTVTTKMTLTSGGRLGVGTAAPVAQLEVDTANASTIGAIIKGFSSQVADLFQVQDHTGAVVAKIGADGSMNLGGPLTLPADPTAAMQAATKEYVDAAIVSGGAGVSSFNGRGGAIVLNSTDVTGALTYTPLKNTTDTLTGILTVTGALGAGGAPNASTQFQSTSAAAANIGAVIKGASGQTADLLQFQNNGGSVLSKVDKDGIITLPSNPTSSLHAATKAYVDTAVATAQPAGNYITALTGDVSASGPGPATATVTSVGGSTAANVHAADVGVAAATNANTASTIVKRDGSGNFSAGTITANLIGNVTGSVTGASSLNVLKTGDTMTGALNLPANGLAVGTDQLTVVGGNVGVGTTTPGTGGSLQSGAKIIDIVGAHNQNAFLRVLGGSGGTKGGLIIGNNDGSGTNYGQFTFDNSNNSFTINQLYSGGYLGLGANSRTTDLVILSSNGNVGVGTATPGGRLETDTLTAGTIGQIVKGASSQTADLAQFQNSSGAVLSKIDAAGYLTLPGAPTSALQAATKGYVDSTVGTSGSYNFVQKAGDTMTGALTLPTDGLTIGTNELVASGGKIGIGNSSPTQALDVTGMVQGSTGLSSGQGIEKSWNVVFANGVTDQKVDLFFPASSRISGTFSITIASDYNFANAVGGYTKEFGVLGQSTGALSVMQTQVTRNLGSTSSYFSIGDFRWDSATSRWRVTISSLTNKGNTLSIVMRATSASYADKYKALDITPIYTSDSTVFASDGFNLNGKVGIGTTNPGARLETDTASATTIGQIVKGAASQSSDLTQFQDSSGAVLSKFDAAGYLTLPGAPTSALQAATKGYVDSTVGTSGSYNFVQKAGDTMSGTLNLPANGLVVGTNQLIVTGSRVGIGTTSPTDLLTLDGTSGSTGVSLLRPSDSASMRALSAPDSSTLRVGGGNQNNVDIYAHTTAVARFQNNGNVGIGTASPLTKLHILGGSGTDYTLASSDSGADVMIVGASHASNTSPSTGTLAVYSNGAGSTDNGGNVALGGFYSASNRTATFGSIKGGKWNATDGDFAGYLSFSTRVMNGNIVERMRLDPAGNLGLGTLTPGAKAEIDTQNASGIGQIIKGSASQSADLLQFQNSSSAVLSKFDANGYLTLPGSPTSSLQAATKGYVDALVGTSGSYNFVSKTGDTMSGALNLPANGLTVGTNQLAISGGNVGVGTSSPDTPLQAYGPSGNLLKLQSSTNLGTAGQNASIAFVQNTNVETGKIQNIAEDSSHVGLGFFAYSAGSGERMRITGAGNVGIGTSSPQALIEASSSASTGGTLRLTNSNYYAGDSDTVGKLEFYSADADSPGVQSSIAQVDTWDGTYGAYGRQSDMVFSTKPFSGSLAEVMRIHHNGNVGIGNSYPGSRLEVDGTSAALPVQIIKGAASQSADLLDFVSSWGAVFAKFDANGYLTLPGAPTSALQAATKGYVDSALGTSGSYNFVAKAGDTMTGALNLPSNGLAVGTNQLVVSGGKVGIGTNTPGYPLELVGKFYTGTVALNSVSADVTVGPSDSAGTSKVFEISGRRVGSDTDMAWDFQSSYVGGWPATYRMDISGRDSWGTQQLMSLVNTGASAGSGKVGIGSTSPGAKIEVDSGNSAMVTQILKGSSSQTADLLQFQNSSSAVLSKFDANGYLYLPGAPTSSLQAATKGYVDSVIGTSGSYNFVTKTGDTMSGTLGVKILSATEEDLSAYTVAVNAQSKSTNTKSIGTAGIAYSNNYSSVDARGVYGHGTVYNQGTSYGGYFRGDNSPGSPTTTSIYGVYADGTKIADGGVNTPTYAMYAKATSDSGPTYAVYADVAGASGSKYGIYSNGGTNYFSGNVGIGSTTSTSLNGGVSKVLTLAGSDNIVLNGTATGTNNTGLIFETNFPGQSSGSTWGSQIALQRDPSSTGSTLTTNISFYTNGGTSIPLERMRVSPAGNVGIGTTAPSEMLEIAGNAKAVSFLYTSDRRLKTDIQDIANPIDKLLALHGVNFTWKKSNTRDVGFIAQDVEKVIPEVVKTDQASTFKSVEYANIVAVVVEAFKSFYLETKSHFNQIDRKVASIETENAELKTKLNSQQVELERQKQELESIKAQLKNLGTHK